MKENEMKENEMKNQLICKKLVQREIVHCCSQMVWELQMEETSSSNNLEDLFCPPLPDIDECELIDDGTLDTVVRLRGEEFRYSQETRENHIDHNGELDLDGIFRQAVADYEPPEVLEHWIVTPWLGAQLKARGEAVGELFDFVIWGRTTSGQSIAWDGVIREIENSMGILVGQKNEWSMK